MAVEWAVPTLAFIGPLYFLFTDGLNLPRKR
jgi:hypothetical protein